MRSAIIMLLAAMPAWAAGPPAPPRFPELSDKEAWKFLPREEPPLPVWARTIARSKPRTAAAMLRLDHFHRERNPLGKALAAKLRWIAADAMGCAYLRAYAEADLKKAGGLEIAPALAEFARKMTKAAYTVTDDEVAALVKEHGEAKVVAMVHTLAHANFQGRIFLALGCRVEEGGPFPALDARFDEKRFPPAPPRPDWKEVAKAKASPDPAFRPPWRPLTHAQAEEAMEEQKARKPRILPPKEFPGGIAADQKARAFRIAWTHTSMGHQPALVQAWFDAMAASGSERKIDPVFANTYFWIITRSNECFY
ncbi:MAG: hypothetical protein K2W96_27495 [Gemmataceae bacterium]|nr:hypothetical protein [Gemmataceae bacterium]